MDALWFLSYLFDADDDAIAALLSKELGLMEFLMISLGKILENHDAHLPLFCASMRCIGNIITGDDNRLTSAFLKKGLLNALEFCLSQKSKSMRKEGFWVLSNVLASSPDDM